jgi:type II secretory pathway pseudopilin PulG
MALPQIAAGISIASSVLGIGAGLSSNRKARRLAREQAKNTYLTRMEEIRREKINQGQVLGANRAAVGASNLMFSGTPQRVLDRVKTDFAQDIAWRELSAIMERKVGRAAAPGAAENFSTIAAGLGSIGSTIMGYKGA